MESRKQSYERILQGIFQNYNSLFEVKIVCKSKECVQFPSL